MRNDRTVTLPTIYHLALAEDWGHEAPDDYTTSTLGRSLADQGFIHCSFREQVQQIADLVYRGRSDVLLLEIDRSRLDAAVKVEPPDGGSDCYPHIYGPINRDAVVRVARVNVGKNGRLDIASAL